MQTIIKTSTALAMALILNAIPAGAADLIYQQRPVRPYVRPVTVIEPVRPVTVVEPVRAWEPCPVDIFCYTRRYYANYSPCRVVWIREATPVGVAVRRTWVC
jgi:hypothetical protein